MNAQEELQTLFTGLKSLIAVISIVLVGSLLYVSFYELMSDEGATLIHESLHVCKASYYLLLSLAAAVFGCYVVNIIRFLERRAIKKEKEDEN